MLKIEWQNFYNADQTNVHYSVVNSYANTAKRSKTAALKGVEC